MPDVGEIVRFCAIECELQRSGERSVHWMFDAWAYAQCAASTGARPTALDVQNLGALVEPKKNHDGYRRVPVRIGYDVLDAWRVIPQQIDQLIEHGDDLDPGEWFYEYEKIHPFVDGNGRTGQILYNWLNESLDEPEWAPNWFDDDRREDGDGAPGRAHTAAGGGRE